jgi:hypothetical protein
VAKVHDRFREERHKDRGAARDRQLHRLMRVLRRADEGRDLRASIAAEALLSKIEGTEYDLADAPRAEKQSIIWRGGAAIEPEAAK